VREPSGAAHEGARPEPPEGTSARVEGASLVLAVGVAAFAFACAWRHLGPDSAALPPFNSDSAVPVLMSNGWQWNLFFAFYLGQDRFGSWPFLLAHGLSALVGRPVTAEALHTQATLFLVSGALPAALLARPFPGLAVLAYTVSALAPETSGSLFEVAQVYPWSLPLLFWAWWCIRRSWKARPGPSHVVWLGLAALVCFMGCWTSPLSGPLLLGLTVLEGLNVQAPSGVPQRRRWVLQLLPPLFGVAGEGVLRRAYHLYVRRTYQRDFRTGLSLDWGHFAENARMVWLGLNRPAVLVALAVLLAYAALLFLPRRRSASRAGRLGPLECTAVGALLLSLLQLPVLVLVRHVRLNSFVPRYFAPIYVFLLFGSLLALGSVLAEWRPGRVRGAGLLVATLGLSVLVLGLVPGAMPDPSYARQAKTARELARRAPGALLLDGYWGTYVFAALAPPGALVPLPSSQELNRMPDNEARLQGESLVVVGHRSLLLGREGSEPEHLFQYGTLLERVEPRLLSDGVDGFSTYRPRAVEASPFQAEPLLEGLSLEQGPLEVSVQAQTGVGNRVLAVELGCRGLSEPPTGEQLAGQGQWTPLQVERVPGAVFFSFTEGVGDTTLRLHFGREPCRIRTARWFVAPSAER
jgi:hypothetical protein